MQYNRNFSEIYNSIYENSKNNRDLFFGMNETRAALTEGFGHPGFVDLKYGEIISGNIIVLFMDIRGFTKISVALENEELIRILQATTIASIYSVRKFGGYIIDLTGDGIMAYFGDGIRTNKNDALNSIKTASFLMDGVKNTVNKHLDKNNDETIRIGIGLEYGKALWTLIGTEDTSQAKPISEVTYIAGKNSSHAKSWEVIMGKNISDWVPEVFKDNYEPYKFHKDGKEYEYKRYSLKWQEINTQLISNSMKFEYSLLQKNLPILDSVTQSNLGNISTNSNNTKTNGPRPLKDQPFFFEGA